MLLGEYILSCTVIDDHKSTGGGEKLKETGHNKEFKTFCSGQLCPMLTYTVSCADVHGSWYILHKHRARVRILETCTPALVKFTA